MIKLFKYLEEKEGRYIPEELEWKHNIYLYFNDKDKITDKTILNILEKAYDFLSKELSNLEKKELIYSEDGFHYGYYKDVKMVLGYDDYKNKNYIFKDIFRKYETYMENVTNHTVSYGIILLICNEYLYHKIGMEGEFIKISSLLI